MKVGAIDHVGISPSGRLLRQNAKESGPAAFQKKVHEINASIQYPRVRLVQSSPMKEVLDDHYDMVHLMVEFSKDMTFALKSDSIPQPVQTDASSSSEPEASAAPAPSGELPKFETPAFQKGTEQAPAKIDIEA